jgi:ribosomal protein L32
LRKAVLALGAILIVLGVVAYAIPLAIVSKQTMVAGGSITIMAGSSVPRAFHLPDDATVSGFISAVWGGNGDIDFYVFDKTNYDNWINNLQNTRYVFIYRAGSGAQFSFRTDREADYYFVFDNPQLLFGSDRSISWSASYDYKPYAPYALPILVSLVAVGALLISGEIFMDFKRKQKMEKLRTCPNCSQKVPIEKTVCPHCGFDISKSIRCIYCNTIYDRSLPKCPNCGAKNK